MGDVYLAEPEDEVAPSMWPENIGDKHQKQFKMENFGKDLDAFKDVKFDEKPVAVDFQQLMEMAGSEKGVSHMQYFVKRWECKRANAARLLEEELGLLSQQRKEIEQKKLQILEEQRYQDESYYAVKRHVPILDEVYKDEWKRPSKKNDDLSCKQELKIDAEYDSISYWKERARKLEKTLEVSLQRERSLAEKLEENIKNLQSHTPVEEFSGMLKRADYFLHLVLQSAPIVIAHQDADLRYRFIFNHFPTLADEDVIGKTDYEILSGEGIEEMNNVKREVMAKGVATKREFVFNTPLFGEKTFVTYIEPVFSKAGETIGVNYVAMDITDQVKRREKMADIRVREAVQKAKETELSRSLHITEQTMRAKQMLATMSHEIRSPLSGVLSMAEILATTKLDKEQYQLVEVMLSSGDLVLQLINDILDLSKVESGAMKLEATTFRPKEVVKHVLQTAAASLKKELTLEGCIGDDVPVEVIGDVLRIRQILTNLISNAVKFTHEGKVGINLQVVHKQLPGCKIEHEQLYKRVHSGSPITTAPENSAVSPGICDNIPRCSKCEDAFQSGIPSSKNFGEHHEGEEVVWLRCDVYDTGIGIPEKSLPLLFERYMQASADHARKYGGTGLGLAICKQLVELMGGTLTVVSKENEGSTFTFVLPCKIPVKEEHNDDSEEVHSSSYNVTTSDIEGSFLFKPHMRTSLLSSGVSMNNTKLFGGKLMCCDPPNILNDHKLFSNGFTSTEQNFADCTPAIRQSNGPSVSVRSTAEEQHDNAMVVELNSQAERVSSSRGDSVSVSGASFQEETRPCKVLEKQSLHKKSKCSPSGSKAKILLVEDNRVNIIVAKSMLEQLGHEIDIVNNGMEAIRALQNHQYNLILMDVHMPEMDGLQATRHIRSYENTGCWDASVKPEDNQMIADSVISSGCAHAKKHGQRVPIIAMTANSFAESANECLAAGMDSYISKPVNFQNIIECLQRYLPSQ
ncbi:probable histidine kinase 1 [Phragmites australis]|uniref:probable histidine kinase 1 n=1 Tax=Phragmites australis TaxID=29695 RepID=UPI002D794E07|nr:probable histidine kinase 1 [Phragmites australis]XP_062229441.1 probable histidine kinase 1 [Phragmites australis]